MRQSLAAFETIETTVLEAAIEQLVNHVNAKQCSVTSLTFQVSNTPSNVGNIPALA